MKVRPDAPRHPLAMREVQMSNALMIERPATSPPSHKADAVTAPSRYRHPCDVLRLLTFAAVLLVAVVVTVVGRDKLIGVDATVVTGLGPKTAVGSLLIGAVQVIAVTAAAGLAAMLLVTHRYRRLATLSGAAVVATAAMSALMWALDAGHPAAVAANVQQSSWITGAAFPSPAALAGAAAVVVAVAPWLNRPWRRTAWLVLVLTGLARMAAGTAAPMELVLGLALGATVGAAVLVAFGAPDRRLGPRDVWAALTDAGFIVTSVVPAAVDAKGSRPFVATLAGGESLFVKAFGTDERDADLLYRFYRAVVLRQVGDTRPAASLVQAVEHEALVGVMAERAGVAVPPVRRVVTTSDGSVLLVMDLVEGLSLDCLPVPEVTDDVLARVWREVDGLHRAGIAHRSMRPANLIVGPGGRPFVIDFGFSDLAGSERQMAIDIAELLASTATLVGAERAVKAAVGVVGEGAVASAVPLLQPLALSAGTRGAVADHDGLLSETRSRAGAVTGRRPDQLAHLYRVRPRTLAMIASAAGAFYFLLPKLAQVGSSWHAMQSVNWAWVPAIVVMSALTYVAAAISGIGSVPFALPFGRTLLTAIASSFVNRVSPANVGGMALNVRYLQKYGMEAGPAVAATGLDSLAGGVVHAVLIVVFFAWAGMNTTQAFRLPTSSTLLVVLAVAAAALGVLLATRWGRHRLLARLVRELRASATNLARIARNPIRMVELFGGSALVTIFYIGALAAAVQAFGGGVALAQIGAVSLGASVISAIAPTPGGLGPLEAALVAGLTAVGMAPGPAVSAVVLYRLATYWLPVLPGWLSLHALQRRGYV
jgi:undecaprenyl-diphosphatase